MSEARPQSSSQASPGEGHRLLPLDGLRGLASSYVVLSHFIPPPKNASAPGRIAYSFVEFGWSGVDLFFVLSGFLITGILLRSKAATAGRYFGTFYARRFLRVFPIYYLMLVVFVLLVPRIGAFGIHHYFWTTDGNTYPYWIYLTNWGQELQMRSHLFLCLAWSLAIEEQYYVVWPMLVWLLTPRRVGIVSIALFAGSALLRAGLYLFAHDTGGHLYHNTFTHLDGIALGSLLAVAYADRERWQPALARYARMTPYLGVILAVLVAYAGVHASADDAEHAYQPAMVLSYWLVALFYGSLLIRALLQDGLVRRVFSTRWLRTLGKYSYAAYLYQFVAAWIVQYATSHLHARFPAFPALDRGSWRPVLAASQFVATYGLAMLSWLVLEGPLNRLKDRSPLLHPYPKAAPAPVPAVAREVA